MRNLFIVFFLLWQFICYSQNQRATDSLQNLLKSEKADTGKIKIYNELFSIYEFSDTVKAKKILNELLAFSLKNKYSTGITNAYINFGFLKEDQGNYTVALKYYQKSLDIAIENRNKNLMSRCLNNIGNIYDYQGNYPLAIEYFQKALKLAELMKNNKAILNCFGNIGIVQTKLGNLNIAIDYYKKALKIAEDLNEKESIAHSLNNLGLVYSDKKDHLLALEYFQKSLQISKEINNKLSISNCFANIGSELSFMGKNAKALESYQKALAIASELGDKNSESSVLGSLAMLNLAEKKYNDAIDFSFKSLEIALNIGSLAEQKSAYKTMATAYDSLGKTKEAFRYYKLFKISNDSLFNEGKHRQLLQMEAIYQSEKKQKEIELLNKEQDLQNTKIRQQKYLIYGFVLGFVILLFFSVIVVWFYKQKKKANFLLKKQNIEILEKNEEIKQQNEEIQVQTEQLELTNKELETLSIAASETDNSIVIADKNGNIEWINAGFTKLFGYTLEEFTQSVGSNIFEASNNPNIEEIINSCINQKKSVCYAVENTLKNGNKLWVQTTITPIKDLNNNITKLVAIDSDISKLKEAEEVIIQKSEELNLKNIQIMDSISYASLIQEAILPSIKFISSVFTDSFVFYKPKDVVSGDFYWLSCKNNFIYFAVVDCTGHGVPGALMSMIGNSLLNEILSAQEILTPAEILQQLNEKVIQALKQGGDNLDSEGDGMDISLCRIDKANKEILFSGAQHTSYIILNGELITVKGDRFSIGSLLNSRQKIIFTNQRFQYDDNIDIYMFSDGIVDQRGGKEFEKYQQCQLIELLKKINHLKMPEQLQIIDSAFNDWRADNKQMDDVTVIGFRI